MCKCDYAAQYMVSSAFPLICVTDTPSSRVVAPGDLPDAASFTLQLRRSSIYVRRLLLGEPGVKPPTQVQQITGAKRRPSGSDLSELVWLADVRERCRDRLQAPVSAQIHDTLLAPMGRTPDDVDLSAPRRQERMGDDGSCRRYANTGRS